MKTFARLLVSLVALFVATVAVAQPPQRASVRVSYVYPAGGQRGTTFTVWVGGQNLNGASAAYFSGEGVTAKITGYERPLSQKEINDLREKQQQLQEKRAAGKAPLTAAEQQTLADIRQKLATRPQRQTNPALAETVTLEVTIAADASPRDRELRLKSNAGLSNPIAFCVGELPEASEPVVTATTNPAPRRRDADPRTGRPKTAPQTITLPTCVNGQILPGEVDRFIFAAKKGQRLSIAVRARALIPYLADAVPGWFQATLALYDHAGREIAYEDDHRFNPDPALTYEIPADGDYAVEIKDSIYRGREDFIYRIAIQEADATTRPESRAATASPYPIPVTFARTGYPQLAEAEPNNTAAAAQPIAAPAFVSGRIDSADDEDVFSFEGGAGEELVAEVLARRLNSPLDSTLELLDASGQRLAFNDDAEDRGAALLTHHADSRLALKLPAAGKYFLRVRDAQHQGGSEFAYLLRVGPPRPDFELRVVPSTINARGGTHVPVTVYALRRDGFDGEILLGLHDPPRGLGLSGARIPAGQDHMTFTLFVPPNPREEPFPLRFGGTAKIGGRAVTHAAIPAEDMMQAFAYHHLVPAQQCLLEVNGRGMAWRVSEGAPVKFFPGKTARLTLTGFAARNLRDVRAELREAPEGISILETRPQGDGVEVTLACDPAKAKSGSAGNLLLEIFGERRDAPNPPAKALNRAQRPAIGSVPAIPFDIPRDGI